MASTGNNSDQISAWNELGYDEERSVTHAHNEWNKISSVFSTAGYREGLSAGKESDALQLGFDEAFASVGVPLGRELGNLRGLVSALLSFLSLQSTSNQQSSTSSGPGTIRADQDITQLIVRARSISTSLAHISFADIVPRDLDAESHARQHLEELQAEKLEETQTHARKHLHTTDKNQQEIISERRVKEGFEDILNGLMGGSTTGYRYEGGKHREEDRAKKQQKLQETKGQLEELIKEIGLNIDMSTGNNSTPVNRS